MLLNLCEKSLCHPFQAIDYLLMGSLFECGVVALSMTKHGSFYNNQEHVGRALLALFLLPKLRQEFPVGFQHIVQYSLDAVCFRTKRMCQQRLVGGLPVAVNSRFDGQ